MQEITYKGKASLGTLLLMFCVMIFIILTIAVGFTSPSQVPIFIMIIAIFTLPLIAYGFVYYVRVMLFSRKGLVLNQTGISYFGKFIISWQDIDYIKFSGQTSLPRDNQKSITPGVVSAASVAMGVALNSAAVGGAIGGGLGTIVEMKKATSMVIRPLDPNAYMSKLSFIKKIIAKSNNAMTKSNGEVIYLNISPQLKDTENLIADISKFGVNVK